MSQNCMTTGGVYGARVRTKGGGGDVRTEGGCEVYGTSLSSSQRASVPDRHATTPAKPGLYVVGGRLMVLLYGIAVFTY